MQAAPHAVIQYFHGEKQNLIPLFQRPYTWKEPNWRTLWEDLMVQYEAPERTSTHFLGAIVSVPVQSVPVGVSKFLVIDGQQRLTTVSILLCALRDMLDRNQAARIQEVYLTNRYVEPEDTLKFVPTQADREAYRQIVIDQRPDANGSLIGACYAFFRKQLRDGSDSDGMAVQPLRILTTLEHSLQVVMINLGDADDPYLIFESLNFKGEPLSQADLVRNYVLMRFKHSIASGGEQERVYTTHWAPMERLFRPMGDGALASFLRHFAMKEGANIKVGGIYAAVKARLKEKPSTDEVEAEIGAMRQHAEFYACLLDPKREPVAQLRTRLEHIKDLDVTTSYPLLLRLFNLRRDGKISDSELDHCLRLIEAFVVRRAVCNVPTNALNKMFLEWCSRVPDTDVPGWLHRELSRGGSGRRYPTDAEFVEQFVRGSSYGRPTTRYILCELERALEHKEPVDLTTVTIEHVMPQTMTDEWRQSLGDDAARVHEQWVHTFGNLTLTGYNAELGNLSFGEKKEKLANTHIELNRQILEKGAWGEAEILGRAGALANAAKEIWVGPVAVGQS